MRRLVNGEETITGLIKRDTIYVSTASRRVGADTHPPESTGETTRTKGGSKGKLSCRTEEEELGSVGGESESGSDGQTHFIREIEQNIVHPFLFF